MRVAKSGEVGSIFCSSMSVRDQSASLVTYSLASEIERKV